MPFQNLFGSPGGVGAVPELVCVVLLELSPWKCVVGVVVGVLQ